VAAQTIQHLTSEELEAAIEARTARIACSRPGWRLVIHNGLKYSCVGTRMSQWVAPVGNRSSDYRGTKTVWTVKSVEPDAGYERKQTRQAMPLDLLIPELKQAIVRSENGRWNSLDWPLLTPENVKLIIDEIDKAKISIAA
jgi:hypothetical protein